LATRTAISFCSVKNTRNPPRVFGCGGVGGGWLRWGGSNLWAEVDAPGGIRGWAAVRTHDVTVYLLVGKHADQKGANWRSTRDQVFDFALTKVRAESENYLKSGPYGKKSRP